MYFSSKKDSWFGLIFFVSILLIGGIFLFEDKKIGLQISGIADIIGIIVSLLIIGLILWMWFGTGYLIADGLIKIRSGPLRSQVKIEEIRKIRATKNPLSAAALSIDRIEISYGKYGLTLLSPKDKEEFVELLLIENPAIQVDKNIYEKTELKSK